MFFNILDYDRNGFIEPDDFKSIGENLCLMLGLEETEPSYHLIFQACNHVWNEIYAYVDTNKDDKASFYEWLRYADEKIVNCDRDSYNQYIDSVVEHIFLLFDSDQDEYISIHEYMNLFMAFRLEVRYSAKAFTRLDLNRDELISRAELKKGVEEFFRSDNKDDKGNWLFGSWEHLTA